jgi:hypothetical protein
VNEIPLLSVLTVNTHRSNILEKSGKTSISNFIPTQGAFCSSEISFIAESLIYCLPLLAIHRLFGHFPIVGLGASAGGLEALEQFFTRHSGYCRVEGEEDKGATFYFSLPK